MQLTGAADWCCRSMLPNDAREWGCRLMLQTEDVDWCYRPMLQTDAVYQCNRLKLQTEAADWCCRLMLPTDATDQYLRPILSTNTTDCWCRTHGVRSRHCQNAANRVRNSINPPHRWYNFNVPIPGEQWCPLLDIIRHWTSFATGHHSQLDIMLIRRIFRRLGGLTSQRFRHFELSQECSCVWETPETSSDVSIASGSCPTARKIAELLNAFGSKYWNGIDAGRCIGTDQGIYTGKDVCTGQCICTRRCNGTRGIHTRCFIYTDRGIWTRRGICTGLGLSGSLFETVSLRDSLSLSLFAVTDNLFL